MPTNPYPHLVLPDANVSKEAEPCFDAPGIGDIEYWVQDPVFTVELRTEVSEQSGVRGGTASCIYTYQSGYLLKLSLVSGPACDTTDSGRYLRVGYAGTVPLCTGPEETFVATFQTPSGDADEMIDSSWLESLAAGSGSDAGFLAFLRSAIPA